MKVQTVSLPLLVQHFAGFNIGVWAQNSTSTTAGCGFGASVDKSNDLNCVHPTAFLPGSICPQGFRWRPSQLLRLLASCCAVSDDATNPANDEGENHRGLRGSSKKNESFHQQIRVQVADWNESDLPSRPHVLFDASEILKKRGYGLVARNQGNSTNSIVVGAIKDESALSHQILEYVHSLTCEHGIPVHVVSGPTRKTSTPHSGIRTRYEALIDKHHDRRKQQSCAALFQIVEQPPKAVSIPNRVDRLAFIRDYQRQLLAASHPHVDTVIVMDFDLLSPPPIQDVLESSRLVVDGSYDVLCSLGTVEETKEYYDTFATVLEPDLFVYSRDGRLLPELSQEEAESPFFDHAGNANLSSLYSYLQGSNKSVEKRTPTPVASCFGGLAIYSSNVYLDHATCQYSIPTASQKQNETGVIPSGLLRYTVIAEDIDRPCEHVVFHTCLQKQGKSVRVAVDPNLRTRWNPHTRDIKGESSELLVANHLASIPQPSSVQSSSVLEQQQAAISPKDALLQLKAVSSTTQNNLQAAWVMSFPNSGTSFTLELIQQGSQRAIATNYGFEENARKGLPTMPVFGHYPNGPFVLADGPMLPLPSKYIATKTHCGGYCMYCDSQVFLQNHEDFRESCAIGSNIHVNQSPDVESNQRQQIVDTLYSDEIVRKAIHLVRDPLDNIVSRYHHIRNNNRANDKGWLEQHPDSRDGFLAFCEDIDRQYFPSAQEIQRHQLPADLMAELALIPCRTELLRYTMWHNAALWVQSEARIPTLLVYYEDYEDQLDSVSSQILSFLELEEERASRRPRFQAGKHYHHFFSQEERSAAVGFVKQLASPSAWKILERYEKASIEKPA